VKTGADVQRGDTVMVYPSPNDARWGNEPVKATVTSAARVWVEITENVHAGLGAVCIGQWRMRRDTQDQGTQYTGSNWSFMTLEQHAAHQQQLAADAFLKEHAIRPERYSRRSEDNWPAERRVKLAAVLRAAMERGEL